MLPAACLHTNASPGSELRRGRPDASSPPACPFNAAPRQDLRRAGPGFGRGGSACSEQAAATHRQPLPYTTRALQQHVSRAHSDSGDFHRIQGADFIGMIFVPKSKRCMDTPRARSVVDAVGALRSGDGPASVALPVDIATEGAPAWYTACAEQLQLALATHRPLVVGVFMTQPLEDVNRLAAEAGIDLVQLHGDEDADYMAAVDKPVLKVIHVKPETTVDQVCVSTPVPAHFDMTRNSAVSVATTGAGGSSYKAGGSRLRGALATRSSPGRQPHLHAMPRIPRVVPETRVVRVQVLLDTKVGSASGGTGQTFDWGVACSVQATGIPIFVAGGEPCTSPPQRV